jgi:hypothetical protein
MAFTGFSFGSAYHNQTIVVDFGTAITKEALKKFGLQPHKLMVNETQESLSGFHAFCSTFAKAADAGPGLSAPQQALAAPAPLSRAGVSLSSGAEEDLELPPVLELPPRIVLAQLTGGCSGVPAT